MKVAVCVEPDALGPAARAALGWALRLAAGGDVIAIAAGSGRQRGGLDTALELGAGRAIMVADPALSRMAPAPIAAAIAAAVRGSRATLVLAGTASPREGRGLVPALVAHAMDAAVLSRAEEVTLAPSRPDAVEARVRSGGRRLRLLVPLPAVITFAPAGQGAGDARPVATARGTIEALSARDLGLDLPALAASAEPAGHSDRRRPRAAAVSSAEDLVARWLDG